MRLQNISDMLPSLVISLSIAFVIRTLMLILCLGYLPISVWLHCMYSMLWP